MPCARAICFDRARLLDDPDIFSREWLVTNGTGAYSSSSICGANTRRYHGLLVGAIDPPVGRAVLLSKLEETLEIVSQDGSRSPTFAISANQYPGATYPQGYKFISQWTSDPCPTWQYSPMPDVGFTKQVWMSRGENRVYVAYTLDTASPGTTAHLHVVPLIAWKDYHTELHANEELPQIDWYPNDEMIKRGPGSPHSTLRISLSHIVNQHTGPRVLSLGVMNYEREPNPDVTFSGQPCWNYSIVHQRELERGLDHLEDLYAPGTLSITLQQGETVVVSATLEADPSSTAEIEASSSPRQSYEEMEERRLATSALIRSDDSFGLKLAVAAEQFLVQAAAGRSTVIAGYHWFGDWGRDTMISLPGLCIPTGMTDIARDVLTSYIQYVDHGMLPNRFPEARVQPDYNTVDATLWYFVAIYRYYQATEDLDAIRSLFWPVLEDIVKAHQKGVRYGIFVDSDSLLMAGMPGVQLTWMDAKIGDWVVTPRTGKPVEINALWYNALKIMSEFARLMGDPISEERYASLANIHADVFRIRFCKPDGLGLYDVLDTPPWRAPDESVRPNQIFAVSLPFPVLDPASEAARSVVDVVQQHLYTSYGLRTLSPEDPAYRPVFAGSPGERDSAYHQGTVWPWLLGPFVEAHYRVYNDRETAMNFLALLEPVMETAGIGSISEVYDGGTTGPDSAAQRPGGCIAQAWSVAETLRVWFDLDRSRRRH